MKNLLLLSAVLFLSGCASSGLNVACGNVTGNDINYPGIVNKASANLYICHIGCVGVNCKQIDPSVLETVAKEYFDKINPGNKIITSGPSVISVEPVTK